MVEQLNQTSIARRRKITYLGFSIDFSVICAALYFEYFKFAAFFALIEIGGFLYIRKRRFNRSFNQNNARRVEGLYISEDGSKLTLTVFPHTLDCKHVYSMDLEDCRFEKVSEAVNGELDSKIIISDSKDQVEINLNDELKPEIFSNGLKIFSKRNQELSRKWIAENITAEI